MESLAQQNAALLSENAELRTELEALKEKAHRMEIAALKAQIKRAESAKEKAAPPAVKKKAPAKR